MKIEDQNYNKKILKEIEGNNLISDYFKQGDPFLVARAGGPECTIISCLIKDKKKQLPDFLIKHALSSQYASGEVLYCQLGQSEENLIKFAYDYCECIKNVDIMGVWSVPDYDWLVNTYCPNAQYTRLWGLEPYHHNNPWSKNLEGKNVLVIHPFEKSIHNNYKNREKLFDNSDVLPEFNLLTIKAEQNVTNTSANYFEYMQRTIDKIQQVNFDIAIIGCGASGLPIGSYIKKEMNKIAIHMGAATQVLFGIIGKRWEAYPQFKKIINKYWTRPLSEEIPSDYLKVENGCYW